MSTEGRAREAEETGQAPYQLGGLPEGSDEDGDYVRRAYDERPLALANESWESFRDRAAQTVEKVRAAFASMDSNKDGGLSVAEVEAALGRAGIHQSSAQVERMVQSVDLDKSGRISFPEFHRMCLLSGGKELSAEAILKSWSSSAGFDHLGDSPAPRVGRDSVSPAFWRILVAGAVAGAVSRTLTAPMDRIKVLLQAGGKLGGEEVRGIRHAAQLILKEKAGVWAFFRGNGVNCLKIAPENATKFVSYEVAKGFFGGRDMVMWQRFLCGAFAGICSSLTVYPFELLKTRLAVMPERYAGRGLAGAFADIVRQDGVVGLFRGIRPSLLGVIPYAGVDLSLYYTLRQQYQERTLKEPSALAVLVMGACSSFAGQTVAYPLQLARTRIQIGQGTSTLRVWRDAIERGGPRALWRGILPNFVKAIPAVSISYVCFESVLKATAK